MPEWPAETERFGEDVRCGSRSRSEQSAERGCPAAAQVARAAFGKPASLLVHLGVGVSRWLQLESPVRQRGYAGRRPSSDRVPSCARSPWGEGAAPLRAALERSPTREAM